MINISDAGLKPGIATLLQVPMGPIDILLHLLNFFAPALGLALLLAAVGRVLKKKSAYPSVIWSQAAINFIVGAIVLAAGLWVLGRDGKMLTYLILVLAMATSQWWQTGGAKQ